MDSYQPIFDAVRSRISNGDVGRAVTEACDRHFDISHAVAMLRDSFQTVAYEMARPFILLRPKVFIDEGQWCALYGENLQDGVAGFGKSAADASYDFDKNWAASLVKS